MNAPDRIWIDHSITPFRMSCNDMYPDEYIRADLVPQWQPIDTAPKDGREFLVCYGRCNNAMKLVNYNRIHGYWESKGEFVGGFMQNGTAWCDFTQPPANTP